MIHYYVKTECAKTESGKTLSNKSIFGRQLYPLEMEIKWEEHPYG